MRPGLLGLLILGGASTPAWGAPPPPGAPAPQLGAWGVLVLWALGVALLGWSLGGRSVGQKPRAQPGTSLPLPEIASEDGIVRASGDPAPLVRALARSRRVLHVGAAPTGDVPAGMLFPLGPGRVTLEEVRAAVHALEGLGPPLAVVVSGALEARSGRARLEALRRLRAALPEAVPLFAFGDGAAQVDVGEDGALRARG